MNKRASNKIENITGLDFDGYKIELNTNHLKHFLYSHFKEKRKDQREITFQDITKIGNVINMFSSVDFGNKKDTLIFTKKYPDGIFELVVTIDEKKKTLSGKSFRIKN
ncbi:MAG: hypothetical protein K5685_06540 [Bacteroidales bacterium]|nr:hypothetical protein [Bacteroidales bacterium]